MTLIIGYLATKVLGIRGGTPSELGASHLFQVWPIANEIALIWPPEFHVDDPSLDALRLMFSGTS